MPLLKKKFTPPPPPPLPPMLPSNKATPSNANGASKTPPRETKQDPPPLPLTEEIEAASIENAPISESGNSSKASSTLSVDTSHSGSKEKLSHSSQEININTKPEDDVNKSSTENDGKTGDGKKEKPKPPNKPSRLKRALTSGSLTLQRLKTTKKRDSSKRLSVNVLEDEPTSEVRDGGLWKLPGMELTASTTPPPRERPLKSTEASRSKFDEMANKLKTSLPQERAVTPVLSSRESRSNIEGSDIKNRELPPLPTEQHAILLPTVQTTPLAISGVMVLDDFETYSELKPTTCEADISKLSDSISSLPTASVEAPPPLPARTYTPTSNESRRTSEVTTPTDSTLEGALKRYSDCYPIRFRVLQGYCNDASDVNMSTNDVYDIHSVKETKVVTVKADSGTVHRIPLDSTQKVGLIYNPTHSDVKGLEGHVFKSIADITTAHSLPKVICSTQEDRTNDGKYIVEENEIFIVKQIHRTLFKGKKGLKVFSMTSKTEKVLPEDCCGYFSTKPSLVRLHFPEIIAFVPQPLFPVRAVLYSAGETGSNTDQLGVVTGVVTMVECSTETSLVASSAPFDENLEIIPMEAVDFSTSELIDLPMDDDMRSLEVAVVQTSSQRIDTDTVLEPNLALLEPEPTYDDTVAVTKELHDIDAHSEDSDHLYDDTVNVLGNVVERSQEFVTSTGHLNDSHSQLNNSTYFDIGRDHKENGNGLAEEDEMGGYDTVGLHLLNGNTRRGGRYGQHDSYDDMCADPRLTSWMEDLQATTTSIEERISSMETAQKPSPDITKVQDTLTQLTTKLEAMESQLQAIAATPPQPAIPEDQAATQGSTEESNKAYLSTLSIEQVCALFDAMSLGQYREHLERELVTGDILLEFDDEVLKEELGIKSRIQRIRVMKVIHGQHSARDLLNK